ncbi:MAG TPA: hypothetical protein VJ947_02300, partial [Pseudohaliea sp.]|nr:hypothetical protein [Pseudohaliea sp.]
MTHPAQARPSSPVGPTSFADPGPRWSRWRRRAAAALLTVCAAAIGATGAPAQQSAAPGPAPEPAQGLDTPVISFNLAGARHLSSGLQYLDLVTMARPWFAAAPGKWSSMNNGELRAGGYLDDQGWPREMPEGMAQLKMFWSGLPSEAASDRSGTYVLSYEGTGEFSFGGAFRPVREEPGRILLEIRESSRGAWLNIVATDPEGTGDYIRNMTLVRQDREDLLALGAMFNPDWLALIADAREIRFMNWNGVNGSVDPQRWEDRPRPDGSGTGRGVPLEHMVQLANEIGVDPWFTMPANATDDYNRGFATAVRDTLDPALTVRVEYSNEIWNNAFRQTRWLQRRSQQDWGERAGLDYGVMRAVRMARIWDEVFAGAPEGRLVKVLGTQAINPWATRTLLAAEVWRKNDPEGWIAPAEVFDELAITTYFGTRAVSDPERRETLVAAIQDPSVDAAAWLTERLRDPDYSSSLPWSAARWQTQAD